MMAWSRNRNSCSGVIFSQIWLFFGKISSLFEGFDAKTAMGKIIKFATEGSYVAFQYANSYFPFPISLRLPMDISFFASERGLE